MVPAERKDPVIFRPHGGRRTKDEEIKGDHDDECPYNLVISAFWTTCNRSCVNHHEKYTARIREEHARIKCSRKLRLSRDAIADFSEFFIKLRHLESQLRALFNFDCSF